MKVIYIRESKEFGNFKGKMTIRIKRFLNIVERKNVDDKVIYYLPIMKKSKLSEHRMKKLCKKINRLLEQDSSSVVALSEYITSNQLFKNYLYSKNINILDGRYLFKCLIFKIIEYILNSKNEKIEFRGSNYFSKWLHRYK